MINPALLKALIPQDVMDNVQNAAQAFIEMRNDINELKKMVGFLYTIHMRENNARVADLPEFAQSAIFDENTKRLSRDNGSGEN